MKKCPYCAEEIQDEAIFCRFCNHDLNSIVSKPSSPQPEVVKNESIKKKKSYLKYSLLGALAGIGIGYQANSLNDKFFYSLTNIFIYGGVGFAICAIKNKEYKKIWVSIVFPIIGFLLILGMTSGFFSSKLNVQKQTNSHTVDFSIVPTNIPQLVTEAGTTPSVNTQISPTDQFMTENEIELIKNHFINQGFQFSKVATETGYKLLGTGDGCIVGWEVRDNLVIIGEILIPGGSSSSEYVYPVPDGVNPESFDGRSPAVREKAAREYQYVNDFLRLSFPAWTEGENWLMAGYQYSFKLKEGQGMMSPPTSYGGYSMVFAYDSEKKIYSFNYIKKALIQETVSAPFGIGSTKISSKDNKEMVFVPEGEFLMGSPNGEGKPDEHPQHTVWLDAFWIDKYEVTNSEYKKCILDGKCTEPVPTGAYKDSKHLNIPEFSSNPVMGVDWNQSEKYCQWAGQRLPTEAEWEKAARGTDGRKYPWGNVNPNDGLLNYQNNYKSFTNKVGSYPEGASPYGVFDMAGNVSEWTADLYDERYYWGDNYVPPKCSPGGTVKWQDTDGTWKESAYLGWCNESNYDSTLLEEKFVNPVGPPPGLGFIRHILRGGSYRNQAIDVRTTARNRNLPTFTSSDLGFRCVISQ